MAAGILPAPVSIKAITKLIVSSFSLILTSLNDLTFPMMNENVSSLLEFVLNKSPGAINFSEKPYTRIPVLAISISFVNPISLLKESILSYIVSSNGNAERDTL